MTALWQAVKPGSDLVSGMYFALVMLGGLWASGTFVGGIGPRLIAWWERRRGLDALSPLTQARIILLTLTMVWIVMLSIIGADILLAENWTLMPFPIVPE
jgi:hypothetical protein